MKNLLGAAATSIIESQIRKALQAKLGLIIEQWEVETSPLKGEIRASGVVLRKETSALPLLTIEQLSGKLDLGAAMRRDIQIERLTIRGAKVFIRESSEAGDERKPARRKRDTAASPDVNDDGEAKQAKPPKFAIKHAQISECEVVWVRTGKLGREERSLHAGMLALEIKRSAKGNDYRAKVSCEAITRSPAGGATMRTGPINLEMTLSADPEGNANGTMTVLDLLRGAGIEASLQIHPLLTSD